MRAAIGLALTCVACGPPLPDPYVVSDLRVIAMIAQAPELAPGETTVVDVYFFDPDSDARAVAASSYVCADPDSVDCLVLKQSPARQTDLGLAERVQPDLYAAHVPYAAAADIFAGSSTLELLYGKSAAVAVRGDNGSRHTDAFKRVVVRAPAAQGVPTQPKNVNPVMSGFSLTQNGAFVGEAAAISALNRGTRYTLTPLYDHASLQSYVILDYERQAQELPEEASFSWSCSPACTIDRRVSYSDDTVELTTPYDGAESGRFSVHVVMRDGRGGEALYVRTFQLLPAVRVK